MSENILVAQSRTEFGKGASRRLRRAAQIPAVLYGHGTAPLHVALPGHATFLALKQANALLSIQLDGVTTLALPKDVQRDPIRDVIEHVDLLIVKKGEKVTVEVPVTLVGDPESGAVVTSELNTLSLLVEATNIPTKVEVDLQGLAQGTAVRAGDVVLPTGAELVSDADAIVVHIAGPRAPPAAEAAEAAAAAE